MRTDPCAHCHENCPVLVSGTWTCGAIVPLRVAAVKEAQDRVLAIIATGEYTHMHIMAANMHAIAICLLDPSGDADGMFSIT